MWTTKYAVKLSQPIGIHTESSGKLFALLRYYWQIFAKDAVNPSWHSRLYNCAAFEQILKSFFSYRINLILSCKDIERIIECQYWACELIYSLASPVCDKSLVRELDRICFPNQDAFGISAFAQNHAVTK